MTESFEEQRIRERAYAIWESSGRAEDRAEDHWHQAKSEIEAEDDARDKALDNAIDDPFPASDPPAITQPPPSNADKN